MTGSFSVVVDMPRYKCAPNDGGIQDLRRRSEEEKMDLIWLFLNGSTYLAWMHKTMINRCRESKPSLLHRYQTAEPPPTHVQNINRNESVQIFAFWRSLNDPWDFVSIQFSISSPTPWNHRSRSCREARWYFYWHVECWTWKQRSRGRSLSQENVMLSRRRFEGKRNVWTV